MDPPQEASDVIRAGDLEIRPSERTVLARGRPLVLSVREFRLLVALVRRMERVMTREELYAAAWGGPLRPGDRSVDVYVSKLRAKLEAALPEAQFIHTHVGFGYRFSSDNDGFSHLLHTEATGR